MLTLLRKSKKYAGNGDRSLLLQALGKSCQIVIEHKLEKGFITDAHRIAALLDPRMRRHLNQVEKDQVCTNSTGLVAKNLVASARTLKNRRIPAHAVRAGATAMAADGR